ncbi:hypothetical protein BGZ60DRAFT_472849 [Tricladium varicosporioides]|nr:hypothetical protein BGZ60DRAFT_472849 [Hymenoscyphus varicosporioides]
MTSSAALKAAKKELRLVMKQKLAGINQESINSQSAAIFKTLTHFKPYQNAKRVGVYLSMPTGEIQTDAIVRHALENGKQVFVPYIHKSQTPSPATPKSVMDMVDIRFLSDYESLERDTWGIPTVDVASIHDREHILGDSNKTGSLDMILMPGVAFAKDTPDGFMRRLGHGKGFYDYFLHRYMKGRGSHMKDLSLGPGIDALMYGLALKEQFLQGDDSDSPVPVGEHDHLLHGLLVGDGKLLEGPVKTM